MVHVSLWTAPWLEPVELSAGLFREPRPSRDQNVGDCRCSSRRCTRVQPSPSRKPRVHRSSSSPFVGSEKPSLRRRFDQGLGNGIADRASYRLDQPSYAVPHHGVRPGRTSDPLRKESNELRAVGGEDLNWDLPVKEPLAEADAVPPPRSVAAAGTNSPTTGTMSAQRASSSADATRGCPLRRRSRCFPSHRRHTSAPSTSFSRRNRATASAKPAAWEPSDASTVWSRRRLRSVLVMPAYDITDVMKPRKM